MISVREKSLSGCYRRNSHGAPTRAVRQDSEKNRFKLQVNNFLGEVASGSLVINSDLIGSIEKRIADIDKLMSEQLSLIMHATEFQKVESAWTGLYKLDCHYIINNFCFCCK